MTKLIIEKNIQVTLKLYIISFDKIYKFVSKIEN